LRGGLPVRGYAARPDAQTCAKPPIAETTRESNLPQEADQLAHRYEYETFSAALKLVKDAFNLQEGETLAITADTESDPRVPDVVAAAAHAVGGRPLVMWVATPPGVGKAADPTLPLEALAGALAGSNAWVEFNNQWLLYSTPYEKAFERNPDLRYLCLVGMDADMMVRTIERVDSGALKRFSDRIAEMTRSACSVRITTPAGTDVRFENDPARPVDAEDGRARTPGPHFLSGQIGWVPNLDTVEGTIAFDGSLVPPCGLLEEPVSLSIERGRVVSVEGGAQAKEFEAWLDGFGDPNMRRLAHVCYGFNPGARLTGNILEDERVWGCTEWGLGYLSPVENLPEGIEAPSHTDGICLSSSVWLDGEPLMERGRIVDEDLAALAEPLLRRTR